MDHTEKILISLLNLTPSSIESIHSSVDESNRLSIFITFARRKINCPFCGASHLLSKGFYSRNVSVPNRAFENISVSLKVPRYKCSCGHNFSDSYSMSPFNSKVSFDSIHVIMDLLQNPRMTFSSVASQTGLSESTVTRIFDKYCTIPHIPFPEAICIDEVYTKLNDHDAKYSCIFYDFYNHTIVDVLPDRRKSFLHRYFQSFQDSKELLNVKYVCIDMYFPYKQIAQLYFKKALICVDSFHVIKHLNESLNAIRIRIMNSYDKDSTQYYLLKQWKSLLFDRSINFDNPGKFNKRLNRFINFRQLLDLMLAIHPDLKKGYELKERYVLFNASSSFEDAKQHFDEIYNEFSMANIHEYEDFVITLENWKNEIINSFIIYRGRRINSSVAESMNATVSTLIFNTRGIRNSERRRKRIMFAVNKSGYSLR